MEYSLNIASDYSIQRRTVIATSYFEIHGFNLRSTSKSNLSFSKGSKLGNLIAFNPLNWISKAEINFNEESTDLNMEIKTTFQLVTPSEKHTWDIFIENLVKSIEQEKLLVEENQKNQKTSRSQNLKAVLVAFISGAVIGIPTFYFVGEFDLGEIGTSIGLMWTLIGSLGFTSYWLSKQKSKTLPNSGS